MEIKTEFHWDEERFLKESIKKGSSTLITRRKDKNNNIIKDDVAAKAFVRTPIKRIVAMLGREFGIEESLICTVEPYENFTVLENGIVIVPTYVGLKDYITKSEEYLLVLTVRFDIAVKSHTLAMTYCERFLYAEELSTTFSTHTVLKGLDILASAYE